AQAYQNSLKLAALNRLKSIALPAISTGAYGYPVGDACQVALITVKEFLQKDTSITEVVFVLFSESVFKIYLEKAKEIL
ncbi:MAG: macro domain-containing protein, partial [Candidatus Bathyarchaeia archaeon]